MKGGYVDRVPYRCPLVSAQARDVPGEYRASIRTVAQTGAYLPEYPYHVPGGKIGKDVEAGWEGGLRDGV